MNKRIPLLLSLFCLIFTTGCIPLTTQTTVTVTQPSTVTETKTPTTVTITKTTTGQTIVATTGTTTGLDATPIIVPVSNQTVEADNLVSKTYSFTYGDFNWTWDITISQAMYEYFKALNRPHTPNYSIYVTHPLDDPYIEALANKIKEAATKKNYNEYQTVSLAAAFVQSLDYTSDSVTTGYDEYPRYPVETLFDNGGDCEDTAILTASLIRALGYGVIILVFDETTPGHVAVGVEGGEGVYGSYWTYQGEKYYYLETTGQGWEIGEAPEAYQGTYAKFYPMISVPILTHDWETTVIGNQLQLKVTVTNLGSALAEDIYVYAGFDAGNDQTWNHKESPLFNLDFGESIVATLYLSPPVGEYTRLIVQIVYGGFAVDESYSDWYDT